MENLENEKPLKIIGLKVDGLRKLSAVNLEFKEKGLIPIVGKNRNGKTTLAIDTVKWLIQGNKVLNGDIVKHGQETATAELRIGDYVIERAAGKSKKFKVTNVTTHKNVEGEVQNFLNTFINELTFNPRPFLDSTPYEKLRFCMNLFKIDFTQIDSELKTLEEDRKYCGQQVKRFGEIVAVDKFEAVSISELLAEKKSLEDANKKILEDANKHKQAEIEKINEFNKEQREKARKIEVEQDRFIDLQKDEEYTKNLIIELEGKLKETKAELKNIASNRADCESKLHLMSKPEPEKPLIVDIGSTALYSTAEIDTQIEQAFATNEKARQYQEYLVKLKDKADKETEYKDYSLKIENLRNKKLEILSNTKTGVDGLEIQEDGIYYKGISSENWSDSEGLVISSELCLAQMPKLRAVFLDRAESLDSDSLAAYGKWAEENNVQAIVTIVRDIPEQLEVGVFYLSEGKLITKEDSQDEAA